jgi:RHS repeat-associated protein
VASASYNAANQLTNWAGTEHSYDTNGNLTGDGSNTYSWDSRNRLVGISGGVTASFTYDARGRRTSKTVDGASTGFLYDGLNPVQELSGSTPSANLLTGLGLDQWFARSDSSGTKSFLTDALGSVLALTDSSGAVQTQYGYEPYGKTTQVGAASGNGLQYTGRENDGTGLYYYRARYYAPGLGRFVAEDPIGFGGGWNTYAYVKDNPINRIDPRGLWSITFGGYYGVGGQITFGSDDGHGFMTGRVGFGLGGGIGYDPYGGIPGSHPLNDGDSGFVANASWNLDFNAPFIGAGLEGGVARNYSRCESEFYKSKAANFGDPFSGIDLGGSIGAGFTYYSPVRK